MLLIAGLAFSLWLGLPGLKKNDIPEFFLVVVAVLGGLSLFGPPLLLAELRRRRRRWRAGKVLWFSTGMASWLLWPPAIYRRTHGLDPGQSYLCYAYGTPLMAIYVTTALLAGGWLRRGRRNRVPLSWRDQFGLLLGMAWACTGLYVLYLIYSTDLGR
jgi:hypothetical protein